MRTVGTYESGSHDGDRISFSSTIRENNPQYTTAYTLTSSQSLCEILSRYYCHIERGGGRTLLALLASFSAHSAACCKAKLYEPGQAGLWQHPNP